MSKEIRKILVDFRSGNATKENVINAVLSNNTTGAFRLVQKIAPKIYRDLMAAKGLKNYQNNTGTKLTEIKGLGPKTAELLKTLGIADIESLATANEMYLQIKLDAAGFKTNTAEWLINAANNF